MRRQRSDRRAGVWRLLGCWWGSADTRREEARVWVIVPLVLMTCFLCKTGKRQYAIIPRREQLNAVDEQSGLNHALSALYAIKLQ